MPKRKAEDDSKVAQPEHIQRPAWQWPTNMAFNSQPSLAQAHLDACNIPSCLHCDTLTDLKWRYAHTFGAPASQQGGAVAEEDGESVGSEPTLREDNAAFAKICELEAENEKLRRQVALLADMLREAKVREDELYRPEESVAEAYRKSEDAGAYLERDVGPQPTPKDVFIKPSIEPHTVPEAIERAPPSEVFVVHFRYNATYGQEGRSATKGVYGDLQRANAAAWEAVKEEFDNWDAIDIDDMGVRSTFANLDYNEGQKIFTRDGRVKYAVDEGNDGTGYVTVERHPLL